jgi:hypothetical protein
LAQIYKLNVRDLEKARYMKHYTQGNT